ncbi:hypothetical protein B7463_g25, partial [Scytalidium lignicola]
MDEDRLLANLNPSQHAAVSSVADTLAILAGPGSGKTHTLTSRTAWLLRQGIQPWNIIVATFTVKAAREMKERIGQLVGNGLESKLILGTFHSIARRYLARYGHLIDIRQDFGIADSADSLAILKRIVKRHNFIIDPKVARSRISSRKARGSEEYRHKDNKLGATSVEAQEFEQCYTEYEAALARSNLLDYDDLLLRCVTLLRTHPSCVSNVEAVLIDEFQDTNIVQFDLMRLFASARKRITIVGDPDQSIYGFRAAEIKNYKRLLHQYPDTVTIPLEENYRSSGAILLSALNVIEQDTSRIAKSLTPTHVVGTRPVLRKLPTAQNEADWIVTELQRCMGLTGNLLSFDDFAILLRSASLSRHIESAFGKAGVPYRIVGGLRFYDRLEVKTLLDYLRVINQPDNNDALARIINVPSRRIGEATIKSLIEEADRSSITLWTLILDTVQGRRTSKTKLPKLTLQGLSTFINIIITARKKMADAANSPSSIVDLIDYVLKKTNLEDWLEIQHGDITKARWANVQEFLAQASDFQSQLSSGYEDDSLPQVDGLDQDDSSNPLSKFLANVALASEVKKDQDGDQQTALVTISTIHAAKGLEWPVVFIPAVYQGSIPHSRAEDTDEERRLLYVAMTRAQSLLYLSYPLKSSQGEQTSLSPFVSSPGLLPLLAEKGPSLTTSAVQSICQILRRLPPSAQSVATSSASLPSQVDDLFPIGNEGRSEEDNLKWGKADGRPSFTMGQRHPIRQRIELQSSTSDPNGRLKRNLQGDYKTTMDRVSSFTTASVTMHNGFVSAGSHMLAFGEEKENASGTSKKQKPSRREGQDTILTFFGNARGNKSEMTVSHTSQVTKSNQGATAPQVNSHPFVRNNFSATTRPSNSPNGPLHSISIPPTLAEHRLPSLQPSRPRKVTLASEQQQKRNDYVFLSSSPPRAARKEDDGEIKPVSTDLDVNSLEVPHSRPAVTMHATSILMLQQAGPHRKTLGVKRSMNGWSSRKCQSFVPPTMMKRPP